ncbi:MAG: PAS domain S-box protein [Arcobacteraceae bacterium]|nr:PAS domain S-box protein [Arcobacteraceae bacterium]
MLKKVNYAYIVFVLFIFFILYSFHFILKTNDNTKNNYITIGKIESLNLLDKKFDNVLSKKLQYINIDEISKDIHTFNTELNLLKVMLLESGIKKELSTYYQDLQNNFFKKRDLIKEFKKHNSLLVGSMQKLLKLQAYIQKRYYFSPIGLEVNAVIVNFTQSALGKNEYISYINKNLKNLQDLDILNNLADKQLDTFISSSHLTLKYVNDLNKAVSTRADIHLDSSINNLKKFLISYFEQGYKKEKNFSYILLFIIISFLIVLMITYELDKKHKIELLRFRKAVENSDNSIVITDIDRNITYVNSAFEKNTGYTKEEAIGQNPNILKSGDMKPEYYKELNDALNNLKIWHGEFINKKKNGEIFYERASIVPIIMDDELNGFLAIKLDITEYIEQKNALLKQIENSKMLENENQQKERIMFQQSKMASMGEMFENIAHQWRQPLSVISTSASGMKLQKEFGMLSDEMFNDLTTKIVETTEHMSKTIDDFRNFFKKNKDKEKLNLKDSLERTLSLLSSKLKNRNIVIIKNMQDLEIFGLDGELIQSFMNIFSNAQDALIASKNEKNFIFVDLFKEDNLAILKIKDTAGGIPKDTIEHIFEPYFTTKHKSHGTGIGLYMTYEIIVKHHHGTIEAKNCSFDYENNSYKGAEFIIKFPLD